ncbi:hypothetical protein JCM16303_003723 [Sporobolomyces ruberrimus]
MLSPFTRLTFLALATSLASINALPTPAGSAEFDDLLVLSPRELVPAYVDKRDVPDYTAPKGLKQSIAYFPSIESPSQGSVWTAGGQLTVAWNNTKPNYAPNQIHNYASLLLGFRNPDDPASGLNLDIERPLANVSLYGTEDPISVQLPSDLPTRSTYLLVLGSTANMSPLFTIEAVGEGSEESGSSSSSSQAGSSTASATRAIVAAPSSTDSSEDEPLSTSVVAATSASRGEAGRVATSSPTSSESSEDSSPSPTAEAVTVVSTAPSSLAPSSSASPSSTRSVASPLSVSGGALAASASPTSGASTLSLASSTLVVASLVALACMI